MLALYHQGSVPVYDQHHAGEAVACGRMDEPMYGLPGRGDWALRPVGVFGTLKPRVPGTRLAHETREAYNPTTAEAVRSVPALWTSGLAVGWHTEEGRRDMVEANADIWGDVVQSGDAFIASAGEIINEPPANS